MTSPYTHLGRTPVAEESPAGVDIRDRPEFESLLSEIGKLSKPSDHGAAQVNWQAVVDGAAGVLARQSKDLTVAGYLAVGLLHTRGLDGLEAGLQIFKDLLECFWETLYPPKQRLRGRVGAVQWWLEKTLVHLRSANGHRLAGGQAKRLLGLLKRVDALLGQSLGDAVTLKPLRNLIEALPADKCRVLEPSATVRHVRGHSAAAAQRTAAALQTGTGENGEVEAGQTGLPAGDVRLESDAALQTVRRVSLQILQQDLGDPLAYRFRRFACWSRQETLPPHIDGITPILEPPPQTIQSLEMLRAAGNWPALIQEAEQNLTKFIFWLDLSGHVAEGLRILGKGYESALAAVCQETAGFVQRLPGFERLRFKDGTPLAMDQTQRWLQTLRAGASGSAAAAAAGDGDADARHWESLLHQAQSLAQEKQLGAAVGILRQALGRCRSGAQRMRGRLAMAKLLLGARKHQLALPHLEQALHDIDAFRLEEWDPSLALAGLVEIWNGFSAENSSEARKQTAALLRRIARMDPSEALRLGG